MGKTRNQADYLICLLLILATLAVYWQVRGFGFVLLDDPDYVVGNAHVLGGLSAGSIGWALKSFIQSNWHPLTWISLMADAQIGGANPAVYHLTNVGLHILNTLMLFAFLRLATGKRWSSAAVALLFAIHPLHVESVAWVTERKDVLSTFFWLLTMLAYYRYAARRSVGRYLLVAGALALGLMAKPMLVTLPIVLLLMDIWPLGQLGKGSDEVEQPRRWRGLILEKIPLFAMSIASCGVTIAAQSGGGSVYAVNALPIGARVSNALVACVSYIVKMLWPLNLMPQYPHPGRSLPVWQIAGAALVLSVITLLAIKAVKKRPYLTVGWLWYVVTLIPVIGLVQVGVQAMADRYTYVPLIGLFVIVAWGVPEAARRFALPPLALATLGGAVAVALMVCAYVQVSYWRDSKALAAHAVAVNEKSYLAHVLLGDAYAQAGDYKPAIAEFERGKELAPFSLQISFDLAQAYRDVGRYQESAEEFKHTLKGWPYRGDVHFQAGVLLSKIGQFDRAVKHFRCALSLKYETPVVYTEMASAYAGKHDLVKARQCFEEALRLAPDDQKARDGLSWAEQQLTNKVQDR